MEYTNPHQLITTPENASSSSDAKPTCATNLYDRLISCVFQRFRTWLPFTPPEIEAASSSSSTRHENANAPSFPSTPTEDFSSSTTHENAGNPSSSSTPHEIAGASSSSSTSPANFSSSATAHENAGAPYSSSSTFPQYFSFSATHENAGTPLSSTPPVIVGAPISSSTPCDNVHACASPLFSTACSSASYPDYDIFINHRGPDVKDTFATALYRRLAPWGLQVFLDKPEMQAGLDIPGQIKHAIETASIHIAIFSPGYAQSSYCLHELHQMLKCNSDQAILIPVFYRVKPSDVRWTANGLYGEALRSLETKKRYDPQTIQGWKNALSHAAGISGFELEASNGDDDKLLDEIVERVLEIGKRTPLKYVTLPEFQRTMLLQQPSFQAKVVEVVGIVGPGGIGKTKLGQVFFNSYKRSEYSGSCFLSDVKESSLTSLQRKLIRDLTQLDVQIDTIEHGVEKLKNHVTSSNALIVVDDVDHADQLAAILPIRYVLDFNSFILVTSRDKNVLITAGIREASIYNLTGLYTPSSKTNLRLGSHLFEKLPPSLDQLTSLKELWLHDSPNLKCLSAPYHLLNRLTELNMVDCGIESLSEDVVKMNNLKVLRLYNCPLGELSFRKDGDKVILLREAKLLGASSKMDAPYIQGVCPNLQHLWINSCRDLVEVGVLPTALKTLDVSYCNRLREIRGLCFLGRLEKLDISGCVEIEELPSLHTLKSLKELKASRCYKLKSIEGLAPLSTKLRSLYVRECLEIQKLPGVERLMSLEKLDAFGCPKLDLVERVLEQLRQRLKGNLLI